RLWKAATGQEVRVIQVGDCGYPMTFSPDGGAVVSGSWDGTIRFWETETGREIHRISIEKESPDRRKWDVIVDAVSFGPDGRTLLSAGAVPSRQRAAKMTGMKQTRTGLIQAWNTTTGEELRRHQRALPYYTGEVIYSPDGEMLLFQDPSTVLW